jgi:hypothetical protein
LAALLMPALQGAKDRAETVKCLANHRNVLLGAAMYETDYGDWFPGENIAMAAQEKYRYAADAGYDWIGRLEPPGVDPHMGHWLAKVYQHVPVPKLLYCPVRDSDDSYAGIVDQEFWLYTNYSVTNVMCDEQDPNYEKGLGKHFKTTDLVQPGRTFLAQGMMSREKHGDQRWISRARTSFSLAPYRWPGEHNMADATDIYVYGIFAYADPLPFGTGLKMGTDIIYMGDLHAEVFDWPSARALNCNDDGLMCNTVGYLVDELNETAGTGTSAMGCHANWPYRVECHGIGSWCGTERPNGLEPKGPDLPTCVP